MSRPTKEMNTNLKLLSLFYKYTEEETEEAPKPKEVIIEKVKEVKDYESYAPYNFSWFVENKIAAMGWPQSVENLNYIVDAGVNHLITLSAEKVPPILECEKKLKWTEIPIKEFGTPSLKQVLQFIGICERAKLRGEVLGVHCRHGRGRTGTMLACYLVYFKGMAPERAVLTVRVQRPGSCETYEQEKLVCHYHDCVRGTISKPDYKLVDDKSYFDATMLEEEKKERKQDGAQTDDENETVEVKPKRKKSKAMVLGVHCRQGRSRSGIMLACYLIHFHRFEPDQAMNVIRMIRPGSCDCAEHEEIVGKYYLHLTEDNPLKFGVRPEVLDEFIEAARLATKKVLSNDD